jgi:hypothetical protein
MLVLMSQVSRHSRPVFICEIGCNGHGNIDDDDFGDAVIKQTEEEEKLGLVVRVYPG